MTTPKLSTIDNVSVNLLDVVTTCNQQSKQQVFKEKELIKTKGVEKWQQKKCLQKKFIEIIR